MLNYSWLGGTAPEWVAAIGTACATLIAAIALMITAWDRRRAPASRINGWPLIEEGIITKMVLTNAGDLPVFDVIARVIIAVSKWCDGVVSFRHGR